MSGSEKKKKVDRAGCRSLEQRRFPFHFRTMCRTALWAKQKSGGLTVRKSFVRLWERVCLYMSRGWTWRGGGEEDRCGVFVQESLRHTCRHNSRSSYDAASEYARANSYVHEHLWAFSPVDLIQDLCGIWSARGVAKAWGFDYLWTFIVSWQFKSLRLLPLSTIL